MEKSDLEKEIKALKSQIERLKEDKILLYEDNNRLRDQVKTLRLSLLTNSKTENPQ